MFFKYKTSKPLSVEDISHTPTPESTTINSILINNPLHYVNVGTIAGMWTGITGAIILNAVGKFQYNITQATLAGSVGGLVSGTTVGVALTCYNKLYGPKASSDDMLSTFILSTGIAVLSGLVGRALPDRGNSCFTMNVRQCATTTALGTAAIGGIAILSGLSNR